MAILSHTKHKKYQLLEAVRDCVTYSLTEREALAYVKNRTGEELSTRHYYHIKNFVQSEPSTQLWLSQFTKLGFVTEHRKHIDEINNNPQKTQLSISDLIELARDKPFWIWDREKHYEQGVKTDDKCCFNHLVGLPRKDGIAKPLFDYEKLLYDSLLLPLIPEYNNNNHHHTSSRHNNFKDKHQALDDAAAKSAKVLGWIK